MNYCSHCGSGTMELKVPDGDSRARYICQACHTIHYSNPKIVTGCLPVWENKVLLCRRSINPRKGFWNVPGGYLENGETVEQGAVRELWEEARAKVRIHGIHAVFSIPHINQVYIHFLGELQSLDFEAGEESLEVHLFEESDVPWDDMAFASSVFTLRHFFEDCRHRRREVHIGRMEYGKTGERKSIYGLSTESP